MKVRFRLNVDWNLCIGIVFLQWNTDLNQVNNSDKLLHKYSV